MFKDSILPILWNNQNSRASGEGEVMDKPLTKAQKKILYDELSAQLLERECQQRAGQQYASSIAKRLKQYYPDTNIQAEILARVTNQLDQEYGLGSQLCVEWLLDHYVAIEFEKQAYPWLLDIWKYLVEHDHTSRNKLEYFNDCEAFFLDTKRCICVFGSAYSPNARYLVIDAPGGIFHRCWVRKVWRRTRRSCGRYLERPTVTFYKQHQFDMRYRKGEGIYGDCRDPGHVLTYERLLPNTSRNTNGKCDHTMWNIQEPLRWFFEVNTLWTQIKAAASAEKEKT